jgi:hypothetical protein
VSLYYLLGRTNNKDTLILEHTVNGHSIKIAANKENFPNGISNHELATYIEVAAAIKNLRLNNDTLNILLNMEKIGLTFEDMYDYKKFKETNIYKSDIDLLNTIKNYLNISE